MKPVINSTVTTRKRLLIILIATVFLFCVLFGRLAYIQLFEGKFLQTKAAEQWYRDLPLTAPRGKIYDTNGEVIADNKDAYTVYVRPRAVTDAAEVARELSSALSVDQEKLLESIRKAAVSEITVKRRIDPVTAERLILKNLNGVYFTLDSQRNYPSGDFLSQVIGFTNVDNVGQNGIEGYYNTYLTGRNGFAYTAADIRGKELDGSVTRYLPAVPGSDLRLSVDKNIQSFAAQAVVAAKTEFDAKSASMIVMDPKTGAIRAMAIAPSFDLNDIPRDDLNLLNELSKNTLIVDVYEPGSTFKIFTVAAALEAGVCPDSRTFYCPGYRVVDGQRIKCWRYIGHGSQHLAEGVKNSCNCVFMDLALSLGTEKLYDALGKFGFGSKTGVDFFGESAGILMNKKSVKNVDLARIGFGQAVAVTPLQLAAAVCAAVNGGIYRTPYFLESVTDGGKTIYTHDSEIDSRRVISEQTSKKTVELLRAVVAEGSGKKAQVKGFEVGGKTGTAQKYSGGAIAAGKYVSSFVGFAPADDPQYVALMIVDEPNGYMYYGSLVAAPFVGQVMEKIAAYRGIDTEPSSAPSVMMPELIGATPEQAAEKLEQCGLKYELHGEGDRVIATVPAATTMLPEGDVVLLRLE